MTTNQERAAEVLRDDKHYKMGPHGEQFLTSEAARSLADADLLMPDLPEPSADELVWYVDSSEVSKSFEVWISSTYGTVEVAGVSSPQISLPADRAREMALSILAAINHAEQEQENE